MKLKNILKLVFVASLVFANHVHGAIIFWDINTMYIIPDDENTYYMETTQTLTDDFIINGIFEIRSGGILKDNGLGNAMTISGGTVTVKSDGDFYVGGVTSATQVLTISSGLLEIESGGQFLNAAFPSTTGTTNLNGGTMRIKSGGELRNGGGTSSASIFNVNGGTLEINSGSNFLNGVGLSSTGNLNIQGGTLNLQGTIRPANFFSNTVGNLTITSGTFIIGNADIIQLSATHNTTIFGVPTAPNISSGAITIPSGETLQIPSGSTFELQGSASLTNQEFISNQGTIINGASATVTNNNLFISFTNSTFTNNGTFNQLGEFIDMNTDQAISFPKDTPITLSPGATMSISKNQIFSAPSKIINLSSSSIDVFGKMYVYDSIDNGDGGNPGTVNIGNPGSLFLLGANLTNGNASSQININLGGNLYNYYGEVDATLGQIDLNSGGKLHSARGAFDYSSFTVLAGSNFLDSDEISLDTDLDIDFTWTVTGKAVINGNGNEITFGDDGAIVVDGAGSSLLLKDIVLNDVSSNAVRCTHNTTTLSVDHVVWYQDSNFSFTKGYFEVLGDWTILGKNTIFNYTTDQVSTLSFDSELKLVDCTFNYNTGATTRLAFQDSTAHLHLDRAKFLATQSCTLADGTLVTSGLGTLEGTGTLDVSGLDDIQIAGDLQRVGTVTI